MLEIFAYSIGIMYTPGPVNLLGLHCGINRKTGPHLPFFMGVGTAMFLLFVTLGYLGVKVINIEILPYISLAGCAYILYVAWKVAHTNVELSTDEQSTQALTFRDGLLMQLLNPKAFIATLPVSTIQFPSVGITGITILLWSIVLAFLAFGAPTSYSIAGQALGSRISNPSYFKVFNLVMTALLVYVSLSIGYEHVLTPLFAS
ncbi:transporter LysE family [Vibrio astriarenae]|nr:transporter LysE family [Vibrio sp. C7]